jgi:hypothetical protein
LARDTPFTSIGSHDNFHTVCELRIAFGFEEELGTNGFDIGALT